MMRRRPLTGLMAVLCAGILVLGGCSGDEGGGDGDEPADARSSIAADVRSDFGEDAVSEDQARCVADRLVRDLGEDEALAINDSDRTIEDASPEERDAVEAAFNDCMPGSAVAPLLVEPFYDAFGASEAPTDEVVDCVADQLEGKVGTVLVEQTAASDGPQSAPALLGALEPCISSSVLSEPFVEAFVEGGATPEQAACAAEAVFDQLGLAELLALVDEGDLSEQLTALLGDATEGCL